MKSWQPNEKSPPTKGSMNEKDGNAKDALIDFAADLDDLLDEEVVDGHGTAMGTLACYWRSVSGLVVFLGIKVKNIRVVPGWPSQVDQRHSCIRLRFDTEEIESAPRLDCGAEMDAILKRTVYKHYGIFEPQPHGGLRYFAAQREGDARTRNKRKDRRT